jgi:hypothetical protein
MVRFSFVVLILSGLASMTAGCYTMISHPSLADAKTIDDTEISSHVRLMDDCSSCHSGNNRYHSACSDYITFPANDFDSSEWTFYYDSPWWEDNYYQDQTSNQKNSTPLPSPEPRDFVRRNTNQEQYPTALSAGSPAVRLAKPDSIEKNTNTVQPAPQNPTISRRNTDADTHRKKTNPSESESSPQDKQN